MEKRVYANRLPHPYQLDMPEADDTTRPDRFVRPDLTWHAISSIVFGNDAHAIKQLLYNWCISYCFLCAPCILWSGVLEQSFGV